jgi:hypothetical protein
MKFRPILARPLAAFNGNPLNGGRRRGLLLEARRRLPNSSRDRTNRAIGEPMD